MKPDKKNPQSAHRVPTPGDYLAAEERSDNVGADSTNADLVNEDDRLQWLAFCYVADELTLSERADFESRISTELKAQEALASVVELGCGVYGNYQLQSESANELASELANGPALLERVGTSNSPSDRSLTLSRMLLMAAAILVMAVIGYGLVPNSNLKTAHNDLGKQPSASPSSSELSILADDWIDSLDGDEIEIADSGDLSDLSELSEWDSEEFEESTSLLDSNADDDLGVDTSLISFYSEMLDSEQEDGLLNPRPLGKKTGVEL